MDTDVLFSVRNSFYLGAYQAAIAEAADLDVLSHDQREERDMFVYRSYIELGSYELVINEVTSSSSQALQAVKLLAQYQGKKIETSSAIQTLEEWLSDSVIGANQTVLLVAALIYSSEGSQVEALKTCHKGYSLDLLALSIQVLLTMYRVDQAEKRLLKMQEQDEDATLTQLATAWVNLQQGGAKVKEAQFIYKELGERYNWTVRLLVGSAVCWMRMGEWEEAEQQLQEAYTKDAKNAETVANLVLASLHLGKNASRFTNQLATLAPQHPAVLSQNSISENFVLAAGAFATA